MLICIEITENHREIISYDYTNFEAKLDFSLIRVLKSKKRKLELTLFYCFGHENSFYIIQSRFYNFFHYEKFKNFYHNFQIF